MHYMNMMIPSVTPTPFICMHTSAQCNESSSDSPSFVTTSVYIAKYNPLLRPVIELSINFIQPNEQGLKVIHLRVCDVILQCWCLRPSIQCFYAAKLKFKLYWSVILHTATEAIVHPRNIIVLISCFTYSYRSNSPPTEYNCTDQLFYIQLQKQ